MSQQSKVAIIGAGIAGLSCATALNKAKFNVTVFEKSRGASGRLSTRVTENWQCDHGAQYFTARDGLFNAEVQRWVKAGVAQLWQPALQVFDGQFFTAKEERDALKTMRFVGYPANNTPAKWLASALNLKTETTVTSIKKHAQHWQISSKEHGVYPEYFDSVILAIPAPQAAVLLNTAAPKLADLCATVIMQPCFALMVKFSQKLNSTFDGLFINTGLLSWIARDSAKPGRKNKLNTETWVLHASSQWSQVNVDVPKEIVAEQMLAEFIKIIQLANVLSDAEKINLIPHSYDLHRWLYADCTHYLNNVCAYDAALNIGICGDWLNGGKVQGAWLSGLNLSGQLIQQN